MKHNNVMMYNTFMWNWSKSIFCEDALFIKSCINDAFGNEIQWPMPKEKIVLGIQLQELLGCIGFINNNLVKNQKLWTNKAHRTWFNN